MGFFNKKVKPGTVVLNKKNDNPFAKNHPLLQHSKDRAFVMTTDPTPKSGDKTEKINSNEAFGFDATLSFVTTNEVPNEQGVEIGKVSKKELNRLKEWYLKS